MWTKLNINKTKAIKMFELIAEKKFCSCLETVGSVYKVKYRQYFCTAGNCLGKNTECNKKNNILMHYFKSGCMSIKKEIRENPKETLEFIKKVNYKKFQTKKGQEEIVIELKKMLGKLN